MAWYRCTVNEAGPASDGTETPPPVVYINLTDTAGSFEKTWFYAANGIQELALEVAIAAINGQKHVEVGATPPVSGDNPFTDIQSFYLLSD
jgi:hypothetical protein